MPTTKPVSAERRAMLAKVHLAKRDLALTDNSYRDFLQQNTGKRSAAALSDTQLNGLLRAFRDIGWKPKGRCRKASGKRRPTKRSTAPSALAGKARALWRALYALAEVDDPDERALDAFASRQTDVASLRWITARQANQVIEALKSWCQRAGFDVPETTRDGGAAAKRALVRAIWRRLCETGAVQIQEHAALESFADKVAGPPRRAGLDHMDLGQLDRVIERLGSWLRQAKEADGVS